jgi:hypothetical protein
MVIRRKGFLITPFKTIFIIQQICLPELHTNQPHGDIQI